MSQYICYIYVSYLVAEHLTAQYSAIKMLHSRVRLVLEFMREVESGRRTASHDILRDAYCLSHRLPVLQSESFRHEFYNVSKKINIFQIIFEFLYIFA